MPRPRTENTTPTSIRLPPELHAKLDAAREGRPIGEEIRRRLVASFDEQPPRDHAAGPLFGKLADLIAYVGEAYGDWHSDPGAFAVFRLAVDKLIAEYQPKGEPVLQRRAEASAILDKVDGIEGAANMLAFAAAMLGRVK
jgi:hypothetical protein